MSSKPPASRFQSGAIQNLSRSKFKERFTYDLIIRFFQSSHPSNSPPAIPSLSTLLLLFPLLYMSRGTVKATSSRRSSEDGSRNVSGPTPHRGVISHSYLDASIPHNLPPRRSMKMLKDGSDFVWPDAAHVLFVKGWCCTPPRKLSLVLPIAP
jgi:hypothetical protein